MNKFILMTVLFASLSAHANCIGTAQILGHVKDVVMKVESCQVLLTNETRVQQHQTCGLSEGKLYQEGLHVDLVQGQCRFQVGDVISGVVEDRGDVLILDL
ncbi:hypothetical protein D3C87_377790 [compost metagenome]